MNPFDIFPRRNLPPESEEWGRTMEETLVALQYAALGNTQNLHGQNRTSASMMESLAEEVRRIDNLVKALPKPVQAVAQFSNFGIPSTAWTTIGSITLSPPFVGNAVVTVNATGLLRSAVTDTLVGAQFRLVHTSGASPAVPGIWSVPDGIYRSSFNLSFGWTLSGIRVPQTFLLQAAPDSATMWPEGSGSYAVMTAFATFTQA